MDTDTKETLLDFYSALRSRFGHRNWWPGDSPFEVCVGAVLTQNTAWHNVVKAIFNLKSASALDPVRLYEMSHEELAELIKPSGYYNVKGRRLKALISHMVENYNADLTAMFSRPAEALREELLSINGIGQETADSILLYAANKPVFVVDSYTKRVLYGHGLVSEKADYSEIQELFHRHLPRDVALYNDFHAQIVMVGHQYCKRKPLCQECPLYPFL